MCHKYSHYSRIVTIKDVEFNLVNKVHAYNTYVHTYIHTYIHMYIKDYSHVLPLMFELNLGLLLPVAIDTTNSIIMMYIHTYACTVI